MKPAPASALSPAALPPLPLAEWEESRLFLQLVCQIAGKVRMALHPPLNHWWHATLYLAPRGLTSGPIPAPRGRVQIDLDLVEHAAFVTTERARSHPIPIAGRTIADFYAEFLAALVELGHPCSIHPAPYDCKSTIPFPKDREHTTYDPAAVTRAFDALALVDSILWEFRSRFEGKSSPVQLFWHSFDLAVTRFSGRRAPEPPASRVSRAAYSHECSSAGFWFGDDSFPEPAFYCYAWPSPARFGESALPAPAFWFDAGGTRQARMRYEDWRALPDPRAALLDFLERTYAAAADLARWDRAALEPKA